ncbi:Dephospho-CoA kinase [Nitrospina gracilis 3/211]|uniref:Dephospho-CoA kinase n=1 Tax=Nitrospina gracilis (strain 3/211) TaxID=1266370 RepID=M1Z0T6_NITG3|nr:dephospho-CoA kinase [Nitrospina gracilis]MCF8724427.1 dephospho-CoA kinase [Nitrospina sp. Nb-3]CCQ91584.1 Dephospho-CoA kinase [Nitrospina gracilis 3/211]
MALLIGLTGGIGSGKTTVAGMLQELGGYVIDADLLCRELVRPDEPAWREIVGHFGDSILNSDRTLNRARLGDVVFRDPAEKQVLESILHPRVFEEEERRFAGIVRNDPEALVFIDAALLIESGNYRKVDKVIVVAGDRQTQLENSLKKGFLRREEIERRIENQMKVEDKLAYADFIIRNDGDLQLLKQNVRRVFEDLKALNK